MNPVSFLRSLPGNGHNNLGKDKQEGECIGCLAALYWGPVFHLLLFLLSGSSLPPELFASAYQNPFEGFYFFFLPVFTTAFNLPSVLLVNWLHEYLILDFSQICCCRHFYLLFSISQIAYWADMRCRITWIVALLSLFLSVSGFRYPLCTDRRGTTSALDRRRDTVVEPCLCETAVCFSFTERSVSLGSVCGSFWVRPAKQPAAAEAEALKQFTVGDYPQ